MNTTLLKTTAVASPQSLLKTQKNHLVARWLMARDLKLYCQWVKDN